jgi:PhnB protein
MQTSPYLFFNTCCEEALEHYERCGLGHAVEIVRYGEYGIPIRNDAMRGRIMHACFSGPGVLFYASDNDDAEPMKGSALLLESADGRRMFDLFARLSEGGRVTRPFEPVAWGSHFGMLVDRFGVQWMLESPDSDG